MVMGHMLHYSIRKTRHPGYVWSYSIDSFDRHLLPIGVLSNLMGFINSCAFNKFKYFDKRDKFKPNFLSIKVKSK